MYNLGFVSDEAIYQHVKETVDLYRRSIDLKEFNRNVIDPIKLTFDAKVYGYSIEEMIAQECIRQIDKTNSNQIGYFHQNLFKLAGNGWEVPVNGENGFDVMNESRHIYCELKNKHNTMNAAAASSNYIKMQNKILKDDKATCYLVQVIAKHSCDEPWVITIENTQYRHERIRRISIDWFYKVVFGKPEYFIQLCKALPRILDDIMNDFPSSQLNNTVLEELRLKDSDVFRSLYRLAFNTYEGFANF